MARKAKVQSNLRRARDAQKQLAVRKELRKVIKNHNTPDEERFEALQKLQSLPRGACENRVRNRCELTGRPRAYIRKFGLSRLAFRRLAHQGMLPGVTKSSW